MTSVAWIPLTLTLLATIYDLRTREVPDWISVVLLASAVIATAFGSGAGTWLALAAGTVLALLIGLALFAVGAWGGADVKLLAALGAWLGPWGLLGAAFWMAIAGALLSIVYGIRGERTLPYVPAIAAGLCIQLFWPGVLSSFF